MLGDWKGGEIYYLTSSPGTKTLPRDREEVDGRAVVTSRFTARGVGSLDVMRGVCDKMHGVEVIVEGCCRRGDRQGCRQSSRGNIRNHAVCSILVVKREKRERK